MCARTQLGVSLATLGSICPAVCARVASMGVTRVPIQIRVTSARLGTEWTGVSVPSASTAAISAVIVVPVIDAKEATSRWEILVSSVEMGVTSVEVRTCVIDVWMGIIFIVVPARAVRLAVQLAIIIMVRLSVSRVWISIT